MNESFFLLFQESILIKYFDKSLWTLTVLHQPNGFRRNIWNIITSSSIHRRARFSLRHQACTFVKLSMLAFRTIWTLTFYWVLGNQFDISTQYDVKFAVWCDSCGSSVGISVSLKSLDWRSRAKNHIKTFEQVVQFVERHDYIKTSHRGLVFYFDIEHSPVQFSMAE